jgi:hypothetical protein
MPLVAVVHKTCIGPSSQSGRFSHSSTKYTGYPTKSQRTEDKGKACPSD